MMIMWKNWQQFIASLSCSNFLSFLVTFVRSFITRGCNLARSACLPKGY